MIKNFMVALLVAVIGVAFSSSSFAQDTRAVEKKQETKREVVKKEETHKAMGEMKVGSCSPECGFMVRSHNESEVAEMLKMHAQKQHNMTLSDADAKAKIKSAGHGEMREVRKEIQKKEGMREEKKE